MTAPDRKMEKQTLADIRRRYVDAPYNWKANYFGEIVELVAISRTDMSKTPQHEAQAQTQQENFETIELFRHAHRDIGFLLGMLERASQTVRNLQGELKAIQQETEVEKNYAANAAILAKEPVFKRFLKERKGLANATDEATDEKVRQLCGIASRNQLNTDKAKSDEWLKLTHEFEAWKRHG